MMSNKVKVLVFTDWFEPGYKAGGPIRSVSNLIALCKEHIDFYVLTSDRDFQSESAYPDIKVDEWLESDGYKVMYTTTERREELIKSELSEGNYDKYYFNSFFSKSFTISPIFLIRRLGLFGGVVLAPRGMLGEGALALKSTKKQLFIALFKIFGIHRKITFHSTATSESNSIQNVFERIRIVEIGNVPVIPIIDNKPNLGAARKFAFTSRISPKKNLQYLLETWRKTQMGSSALNIYGTIEDQSYFEMCKKMADGLDEVSMNDAVPPNEVVQILYTSDYFVLPTLDENFGHSIIESLAQGCPVIISDQTPWNDLESFGADWVIPLNNEKRWMDVLQQAADLDSSKYAEMSKRALEYVQQKFDFDDLRDKYLKLFQAEN